MADAGGSNQLLQQQQQPPSTLTEDFIVIDKDSPGSSGGMTSPQDSGPTFQLSLLNHRGSETDVQRLAKQIDLVSERQSELRCSLSGNSGSLEQLRGALTDRLKQTQVALAEREAELTVKTEQCSRLQTANREMRTDLDKLRNQQGEWEQTIQDSHKLKNAYDLLSNTKERLQSERDELQKGRSDALAAETAKLKAKFDEDLKTALEAERREQEAKVETLRQELQAEQENRLTELNSKHQEVADLSRQFYEDAIANQKALVAQAARDFKTAQENFQTELSAVRAEHEQALNADRDKFSSELEELVTEHKKAEETLKNQCKEEIYEQKVLVAKATQEFEMERDAFRAALNLARAESDKALNLARAESGKALASERTERQSELAALVAEHQKALESVRKQFEEQVYIQERLAEDAREQLRACLSKHEAEKNELLEQLQQLNIVSACHSIGVATETNREPLPFENSSYGRIDRIGNACASVVDASVRASAPASEASVSAGFVAPESAVASAVATGVFLPADSRIPADFERKSAETQTAPQTEELAEFQVANADSLQKESAVKNLQMQLALLTKSLRKERNDKEQLELELQRLQASQPQATQSATETEVRQLNRRLALNSDRLKTQLQAKQSELDSVMQDLDETRNKLYELMDQVKAQQSGAAQPAMDQRQTKHLQLKVDQLTQQLQAKQSELDSVLQDFDETRHKVYELLELVKEHQTGQQPRQRQDCGMLSGSGVPAASESDSAEQQALAAQLNTVTQQLQAKQSEQQRLQQECERLRGQLQAAGTSATQELQTAQGQPAVEQMRQELQSKQSEIDSLTKDLDETRHKLYELMEQAKGHQSRLTVTDAQAEQLRQKIRELESQAQMDKSQREMELDSARNEGQFKDAKLQSAEKEAEQLRQEVQRLKTVEDELNRRCRDNDEMVQQMMTNAEQEKRKMHEEQHGLNVKIETLTECLKANATTLEQKAMREMQLTETIADLIDRLKLKAEESDKRQMEASRKHDQLYGRMCDQSEMRMQAEKKLKQANQRQEQTDQQLHQANQRGTQLEQQLHQANQRGTQFEQQLHQANQRSMQFEQQLKQANEKLGDSEKFSADMQAYSEGLERLIENLKQQLADSSKKRDEAVNMAEQFRVALEEQLSRSASLDSELSRLKLEYSQLRAAYSEMEQNATQMLASKHETQTQLQTQLHQQHTQLQQTQHRLAQAEEANDIIKGRLQAQQIELDNMRLERDDLKVRVNGLIESLTEQQSNSSNGLFDKHRTMRPPGGGGNK